MSDKPIHAHANRDPGLRSGMPKAFQRLEGLRHIFNRAERDAQLLGRAAHRDSGMVGKDKPHPELKPKHSQAPKREAFNNAWLKEARAARLDQYRTQRTAQRDAPTRTPTRTTDRTRGYGR